MVANRSLILYFYLFKRFISKKLCRYKCRCILKFCRISVNILLMINIDLYESNKIEFKVKFTDQIVKELVAFLNTDGSQIYIGINDKGEIVGANDIDKTLRSISDVITSQIKPSSLDLISCEIRIMEGLPVIVINIKRGNAPIYCIKKYGFSSLGCPVSVGSTCR